MRLRRPTPELIKQFLIEQSRFDLTYVQVGQTVTLPPAGYNIDHTRVWLGSGHQVFDGACLALRSWRQVQLPWLSAWPDSKGIRTGGVVAVLARSFGAWWLNACRIVYTIDESTAEESDAVRKFGFAYGTLPAHVASGEEKFLVEMDDSENVWYDVLAFSRPCSLAARVAYRTFRRSQKQFGIESGRAMQQQVAAYR